MKDQIVSANCKKHIKIWKLSQLGLSRKDIATMLKTNTGHVGNVLRDYASNEKKPLAANEIVITE